MRMFILFLLSFSSLYAQDSTKVLMERGIALHDQGDYEGAIKIYDDVMKIDAKHYLAHYEKSYSLYSSGKYDDCIALSKDILKEFPEGPDNNSVYSNYGSALDLLGKKDEAIKVLKKGMKKYPDFYLLPFNKAITEYSMKEYDDAAEDFKTAITLKPFHASSHIYLAYVVGDKNKIAAAMAISVSLLLETQGERTFKDLGILEKLLGSNVKREDNKNITILLTSPPSKKNAEDDFHTAEMMMSLTDAATQMNEEKHLSAEQKLKVKLESITELEAEKKGFFSKFYIPFFIQMKKDSYMETACHIIYASSGDKENKQWLDDNSDKITAFYKWMSAYKWNKG